MKKKWTIFFLIKASAEGVVDVIQMLDEIRNIELGQEISIIICLYAIKKDIPAIFAGDNDRITDTGDSTSTTIFYKLRKSKIKSKSLNELSKIVEKENFNITNPHDLKVFFKNQIIKKFSAKRYILFTWDHGNGYSIFRNSENEADSRNFNFINKKPFQKPSVRLIEVSNMTRPDASSKILALTMDELKDAISWSFGRKKISLVIMMNCYMQFFDAGYALRNNVEYFVAPQSNIALTGYNYSYFFKKLVSQPNLSSKNVAKILVNSFETKLYDNYSAGNMSRVSTALFANDLKYYSKMAELIDELAQALEKKVINNRLELIMARFNTFPIDQAAHTVDFLYLLKNLRKVFGEEWEFKLINEIFKTKDKILVAEFIGDDFIGGTQRPGLFSIFFPLRLRSMKIIGPAILEIFKEFTETSFSNDKRWNKFVSQFFSIK